MKLATRSNRVLAVFTPELEGSRTSNELIGKKREEIMRTFFKLLVIFTAATVLLGPAWVKADTLPSPDEHSVDGCTLIVGLDRFPDVSLVAQITAPGRELVDISLVQAGQCLSKAYKFDSLSLYAVKKSYVDQVGIKSIDFTSPNVLPANVTNADLTFSWVVANTDVTNKQTTTFTLLGLTPTNVYLTKTLQVTGYNNGKPDKTETFPIPTVPNLRTTFDGTPSSVTATPTPAPPTPAPNQHPLLSSGSNFWLILSFVIGLSLVVTAIFLLKKTKQPA